MIGGRAPSRPIGPRVTDEIVGQFWRRVFCPAENECWLLVCRLDALSYPQVGGIPAHRLSWFLANSIEPGEAQICHSCDTPHCVNPRHLWLGTSADNYRDSVVKGRRHAKGRKKDRTGRGEHWRSHDGYWSILLEVEEENIRRSTAVLKAWNMERRQVTEKTRTASRAKRR